MSASAAGLMLYTLDHDYGCVLEEMRSMVVYRGYFLNDCRISEVCRPVNAPSHRDGAMPISSPCFLQHQAERRQRRFPQSTVSLMVDRIARAYERRRAAMYLCFTGNRALLYARVLFIHHPHSCSYQESAGRRLIDCPHKSWNDDHRDLTDRLTFDYQRPSHRSIQARSQTSGPPKSEWHSVRQPCLGPACHRRPKPHSSFALSSRR